MLNRHGIAHLVQLHDAFVLGHLVGGALLGREIELGIAKHLGRQIGQNLVLRAAQNMIAAPARQSLAASSRDASTRATETRKCRPGHRAVFDRRAGQCPTAGAGNRAHYLAGRAGGFLIRCASSRRPDRNAAPSSSSSRSRMHQLVVGDFDRRVASVPLPATLGLVAFNDRERNLRCPQVELAMPVGDQRLGTNQQHLPQFARRAAASARP